MKKMLLGLAVVLAMAGVSESAKADPFAVGAGLDIGAPSAATASLLVEPWERWVKLGAGVSYDYFSWGGRGMVVFDPIKFPVAPQLEVDGGFFTPATISQVSGNPGFNFQYGSAMLGLGFGNRDGFRFVLDGGMSYVWLHTSNFDRVVNVGNGISIGNPSASFWCPNARLGFQWMF